MEEVSHACAENSYGERQVPVGEGPAPTYPELQHQPYDEYRYLRTPALDVAPGLEVAEVASPPAVVSTSTTQNIKIASGT